MNTSDHTSTSQPVDANLTSGENISFWFDAIHQPISYEPLKSDAATDILVIGGGISGLTTAYCLAKEGRQVILVEDGYIGSGESGRTTAHLASALDDRYFELERIFDEATAQLAAKSHIYAIEWIAKTVKELNIDCHFKEVDGYLFLHSTDSKETLEKEYDAAKRAGLNAEMLNAIPGMQAEEGKQCIKFSNQAQFHILLYLKGLANAFVHLGGKIYTQTKAENITKEGATANGYEVKANHIVVATNTPINDWATMHTKQWPYRSYAIGAKVPIGTLPYALWWDTGNIESKWVAQPYHYVRLAEYDDQYDVLIAGGEDHRVGQADDENIEEEDRYTKLLEWTRKRFPDIGEVVFKWSGQVMEPVDGLAYIGKNPGDENIYIITGDSGHGMTHGTLGGIIITDIITGKENPWIKLYSPSRITLKTTRDYLQELGNMAAQYGDWLGRADIKKLDDLVPGQGGIMSSGFKKVAVYCDEQNNFHTCTAVCPHMGAILQWNADEKTFDCPAHGSRFTTEGNVINGPAMADLKRVEVK